MYLLGNTYHTMKIIYLTFLLCVFGIFGCTTEVLDNERILIEGRVVDVNGNGLENINVKAETAPFLLGEGITDTNGNFSFTSLKTNRNKIIISINLKNNQIETPLNSIVFEYRGLEIQRNYELGDIMLRDTSILDFKIEKTSTTENTLKWQLVFKSGSCERNFSDDNIPDQNLCYEENLFATQNNSERPDFEQQFLTLKNTEAIFTYSIDQGAEQTVIIPINEELTNYVFEY